MKKYFPALDPLRGIAALMILLFHSDLAFFKTFWIGVPIFFTLSGFLITRILVVAKDDAEYYKPFYIKRSLRIFPIYYLALAVCFVLAIRLHADTSQGVWYLFYLQSFKTALAIGPRFANNLMNHTWSLSVEELFYLIWPFLIRNLNVTAIKKMCIYIFSISVILKLALIAFFHNSFVSTLITASFFGNLDSLTAGGYIAIVSLELNEKLLTENFYKALKLSVAALILVIAASYLITQGNLSFIVTVCLTIATAITSSYVILWLAYSHAAFEKDTLVNKVLRYCGKISYGVYLYHYIIFIYLNYRFTPDTLPLYILKIILTFIVATISWRVIEKPLLTYKNKLNFA